ncbi:Cytidylyltransferase family [seawater metagenome]|uniref:Cytidylyltransferase family n=1 Tax=seawater metagenome TaxID=1561972 RepID=A0A5E8CJV1_9ZZZZ
MRKVKNLIKRLLTAIPLISILIFSFANNNFYKLVSIIASIILIGEYANNIEKYFKEKKDIRKGIILSLIGCLWIIPFVFLINTKISRFNILFLIILNSISDSLQYIGGTQFGRSFKYKPFPSISPNKTLIGYVFGVFCAFILGSCFLPFNSFQTVVILLAGVFGDLFASKMKRVIGIKDFSDILGTHGGLLDRFDSLIFTTLIFPCI